MENKHTISIKDFIDRLYHYSVAMVPIYLFLIYLFSSKLHLEEGVFLDLQLPLVWFCVISYFKTSGVDFNSHCSSPSLMICPTGISSRTLELEAT